MRKISNARSSRRAPALKDSDYDHEIDLVDHAPGADKPKILPRKPTEQTDEADHSLATCQTAESDNTLSRYTTAVSNTPEPEPQPQPQPLPQSQPGPSSLRRDVSDAPSSETTSRKVSGAGTSTKSKKSEGSLKQYSLRKGPRGRIDVPTVEVEQPSPFIKSNFSKPVSPRGRSSPETAIDVLYENQRGGLLCGIPLFSPKALGQLDPPAWTNVAHKPSPTNIHTAQVPDPSWEWVWPEWRINRDEGVDADGWEYSFMFNKKFSWHPPKWYNSYVRRRAWVRMRAQRHPEGVVSDPHMLNTEYFTVSRPSVDSMRTGSKAGSSRHSRMSMSTSSAVASEKPAIEDIEILMAVLSRARIDREKIEAVQNFLEHGEEELAHLQHKMHDIMAIFVFQASRRVLISKLNEAFEQTQRELKEHDTGRLQRRFNNLKAAIRHADEECQRLEYWSDIRRIVKEGETSTATNTAADKCEWGANWSGVNNSGPKGPDARCNI